MAICKCVSLCVHICVCLNPNPMKKEGRNERKKGGRKARNTHSSFLVFLGNSLFDRETHRLPSVHCTQICGAAGPEILGKIPVWHLGIRFYYPHSSLASVNRYLFSKGTQQDCGDQ